MQFTTKVKADIIHINKMLGINDAVDIEIESSEVEVRWSAEIEAREWGIKSISVIVESVKGTVEWSIHPDELTAEDIEHIKAAGGWECRNDKWYGSFEVDQSWPIHDNIPADNGSVHISEVVIDCLYKNITVD